MSDDMWMMNFKTSNSNLEEKDAKSKFVDKFKIADLAQWAAIIGDECGLLMNFETFNKIR